MGIKQRSLRAVLDTIYTRSGANLPVCIVVDGKKGQPLNRDQISGFLSAGEFFLRNVNVDAECIPEDIREEFAMEDDEPAPKKKDKKPAKGKKGKKSKNQDIDD
jgi:hypothetical protein